MIYNSFFSYYSEIVLLFITHKRHIFGLFKFVAISFVLCNQKRTPTVTCLEMEGYYENKA